MHIGGCSVTTSRWFQGALLAFIHLSVAVSGQDNVEGVPVLWAKSSAPGGTLAGSATTAAIATDNGRVFNGGSVSGAIQFGLFSVSANAAGGNDAFVAAYQAEDGAVDWAKSFGGSGEDNARAATACHGVAYIVGDFMLDATFGNLILTSRGENDAFVMALSGADGVVQWAKGLGGSGVDKAQGVTCQGNRLYVIGEFTTTIHYTNSNGQQASASGQGTDVFVASMTTGGTVDWLKTAGGAGIDSGYSLSMSSSVLFIAGSFSDTATFGSSSLVAASGDLGAFVASMDLSDGSTNWAVQVQAEYSQFHGCKYAEHDDGVVFVTGVYQTAYQGTGTFGSHSLPSSNGDGRDLIIAAVDPAAGEVLWIQTGGGDCMDTGTAVAYSAGNVLLSGYYCGMDASLAGAQLPDSDSDAALFASFSATNGRLQWTSIMDSFGEQRGSSVVASNGSSYTATSDLNGGSLPISMSEQVGDEVSFFDSDVNIEDAGAVTAVYNTGCAFETCPVQVKESTSTSVFVRWNKGDDTISTYEVEHRLSTSWSSGVQTTIREFNISGLKPFSQYEVRVKGWKSKSGQWSSHTPIAVVSTQAGVAGAPEEPFPTKVQQRWLEMSFVPSSRYTGSHIMQYRYFMAEQDGRFGSAIETGSTNKSFIVDGLTRYTQYRFKVQAQNAAGWGSESPICTVRTLSDLPHAPINLQVSQVTTTSATVTWDIVFDPQYGGGPILKYVVYRKVGTNLIEYDTKVAGGNHIIKLQLQSGTRYVFALAAVNDAGESELTNVTSPFTTTTDTIRPTIVHTRPKHSASGVAVTSSIRFIFSEAVRVGSGTITFQVADGEKIIIGVVDTSQVTVSSHIITVTPLKAFQYGKIYSVITTANAFKDTAQPPNFCDALTGNTFTFGTVFDPNTAPSITNNDVTSESDTENLDVSVYFAGVGAVLCISLVVLCICRRRLCAAQIKEPKHGKVVIALESASLFTTQPPVPAKMPSSIEELYLTSKQALNLEKVEALFCRGAHLNSMADLNDAVAAAQQRGSHVINVQVQGHSPWCYSTKKSEPPTIHLDILGEDRRPLSHPNPVSSSEISTESSSHRDDFEFRNSLFGHFNKLEEEMGLSSQKNKNQDEDLEAFSANALQISKEALAQAQKHRTESSFTTRQPSSKHVTENAPSGSVSARVSKEAGDKDETAAAAKEKMTKMRQSLAAKRRAKGIGEPGEEVTQSTAETVTSNTTEETAAQRKQRLKRQLGARVKERVSTTNAARGPDG